MPTPTDAALGSVGPHCPIDLPSRDRFDRYRVRLSRSFDADGFERGERIDGFVQCPKCDLWWPCVEEPDEWTETPDGQLKATGWWGGVVCEECELLMVEQPDGTPEVYSLRSR